LINKSDPAVNEPPESAPRRIRLPGFVHDEDIGLGDVLKRATAAAGIRPCGGCTRRAEALNRRMVITGRRPQ
jgi:hypothetical protein